MCLLFGLGMCLCWCGLVNVLNFVNLWCWFFCMVLVSMLWWLVKYRNGYVLFYFLFMNSIGICGFSSNSICVVCNVLGWVSCVSCLLKVWLLIWLWFCRNNINVVGGRCVFGLLCGVFLWMGDGLFW